MVEKKKKKKKEKSRLARGVTGVVLRVQPTISRFSVERRSVGYSLFVAPGPAGASPKITSTRVYLSGNGGAPRGWCLEHPRFFRAVYDRERRLKRERERERCVADGKKRGLTCA